MHVINNISLKFKENKSFYLIFVPVVSFVFIVAALLLVYPQTAADGIRKGVALCLETVVPSLFPFMFAVTLIYDMGVFDLLSKKAFVFSSLLFKLPGVALPIMIMSLLGGFPIGATLIEKAYDDGELSSSQASRMLMFCINPGPAFAISVIGSAIVGSVNAGLIIYISVTLSSLFIAFISRFFAVDGVAENVKKSSVTVNCSSSVLSGVINKSSRSTVNICVCILVFSCIDSLFHNLMPNENLYAFSGMLSEVTNGVLIAHEFFNLPVISAVVSFAGFCVHFQVLPVIVKLRVKYRLFLSVRLISAALSCIISYALLRIFPQYDAVVSLGAKPDAASFEASFPVCVWLMIMCGLFLIGDNYIVGKKLTDKRA